MPLCPTATNEIFARDLLAEAAAQKPSGNLVVSPLSVLVALSVAYAGARGSTVAEYRRRFLGCGSARSLGKDDADLMEMQLESLNRTLSALNYSPSLDSDDERFEFLQRLYVRPNFQMNSKIRNSVENLGIDVETNGEPWDSKDQFEDSGLSLVSSAMFRVVWRREFRDAAEFGFGGPNAEPKPSKPLPMMFATIPVSECRYVEREDYQSITIPLADPNAPQPICPLSKSTTICPKKSEQKADKTITFVLPKVGIKVENLLREGDAEVFAPVDEDDARTDIGAVHIALPKFRVFHKSNLMEETQKLGLLSLFQKPDGDNGFQQNFQTFAQTSRVEIGTKGEEEPLPDDTMIFGPLAKFHAQRPFGFGIHAADGTTLFVGIIRNPMGAKRDH